VADAADGSGNRLVLLAGVTAGPLAVNDKITATFPTATGYRLGGDEFTGAGTLEAASTATGTSTTFSSGPVTSAGNDLVFGAVSIPSGTAAPAWAAGWSNLGTQAVGNRYLGRAYTLPSGGPVNASGSAPNAWLAAAVALR
jgi:hypothetical protein